MHEEYLGEDYHRIIRKGILHVDEKLCPDALIDAIYNIGAMKMIIAPALERAEIWGKKCDGADMDIQLKKVAVYVLSAVLCPALKSRTAASPFNEPVYHRDWEAKRKKCMDKATCAMVVLRNMG